LLGRNDDALAEMRKAANLDPLSLNINSDLAEFFLIARFPDESIPQSRKTIDMDPAFPAAHNQLAQGYLAKHLYTEAIAELQKSIQLSGDSPIFTTNLARTYVATNRKAEAVELLNDLKRSSVPGYPLAAEIAMVYTALGDKDHDSATASALRLRAAALPPRSHTTLRAPRRLPPPDRLALGGPHALTGSGRGFSVNSTKIWKSMRK
jgi:predicted Zn-dependent protease